MSGTPRVIYRQLGKSGLRVSVPILAAMSFGDKGSAPWTIEEEQAIEILKAAWDAGVTTIDTANMYSNGVSEEIIGKFIKTHGIPRHKLVILTKCFFPVGETHDTHHTHIYSDEGETDRNFVNNCGLSRTGIFNAVERSLQRLQTGYIDLPQVHRFDPTVPVEETMKALHDLIECGKVRYIGASSMSAWQFAMMNAVADARNWTRFVSMQNEYSLLYREEEREMIPYCLHNDIGLIPWAPLASGSLARPLEQETARSNDHKGRPMDRTLSESDQLIVRRVEELAKKKNTSMAQIALAWTMNKAAAIGEFRLTDVETRHLEEPYEPRGVRLF
ncbi:Aldo/keto reductase [Auricularia subglabra TFB-10046 SS5]|nr:Aldo/keto reductase [Auricularia subglabra TFB-10046 SS5]